MSNQCGSIENPTEKITVNGNKLIEVIGVLDWKTI
jgi:hypothetical protein